MTTAFIVVSIVSALLGFTVGILCRSSWLYGTGYADGQHDARLDTVEELTEILHP